MIGLALVTLVGVLAAGLRTGFKTNVNKAFVANYAITATNNFSPIGLASEHAVRGVSGVTSVVGIRAGDGKAFGSTVNVTGVPPNASQAIRVDWTDGGPQVPAAAGRDGAFVDKAYAKAQHLQVGSPLSVETPTGQVPATQADRHQQPAQGSLPVRRRLDLPGPVRPRLPEPSEPLLVREHAGRRHARRTRTA